MSVVIPAVVSAKAVEFLAKVGYGLLKRFNKGPFHRWAEKKRRQYADEDATRR